MLSGLLYKPRPAVDTWAEANLRLTRQTSPNAPGPLSLDRTPYLREPLNSITDPQIEHIYLAWGAQNAKTLACIIAAGYLMEHEPFPLLWSLPTDKLAKTYSKNRIQPFFRANPCLARHIRRDPSAFTDMEMNFDCMDIYMTGVTSPANLSSRPIAYAIMDEEAKYEHTNRKEAHPSSLIEERTKSFPRRLHLHASTPNIETDPFWQGYLRSDQRMYYIPCPHCSTFITLEFSRQTLVWETPPSGTDLNIVEATARYICPLCQGTITNEDKLRIMLQGEWRPTNTEAHHTRRGYHLNSLYSPFVSFGQFARKFCECQIALLKSLELQNFRNSWEALPYAHYTVKVEDASVEALKDPTYRRGDTHMPHYICIVCYDPGELQTHWEAMLIGTAGETWIIDWGTILGIRTEGEQLGILAHFETLRWGAVTPELGFVDSGWSTQKIYDECADSADRLYPTRGSEASYGTWHTTRISSHPSLTLYTYIDRQAKIALYGDRISRRKDPPLHFPADVDKAVISGHSGQILEEKPGSISQWKRLPDDHYGDCTKIGQLAWQIIKDQYPPTVEEYKFQDNN